MNENKIVRIAGTQGFYGDSPMAAIMIAMSKAADYLMHDALAELTLSILQKDKLRDAELGYARDIELHAKKLYPITLANKIKVVSNSGGLNPHAAAIKVKSILNAQGISDVKIAAIDGDDLLTEIRHIDELHNLVHMESGVLLKEQSTDITHANVYVGAQMIKEALDKGADIVLAGRVADPCLCLGILAHEYQWDLSSSANKDLDKFAAGIAIGHILECGGQASGGNSYAEWENRSYGFAHLGYPIAHVELDGSAIITKMKGTSGKVSRDTIREQIVYEIHDPENYITPDVIVDLSAFKIEQIGKDQVRISGAKGKPKPEKLKLCIGMMEGYMTEHLFYFSYPFAYDKAKEFVKALKETWQTLPFEYDDLRVNYLGINGIHENAAPLLPDSIINQLNEVGVRIAFKHKEKNTGKYLIQSIICLGLNGPPGLTASMNWGKSGSMRLGLFPTLIPRELVKMKLTLY